MVVPPGSLWRVLPFVAPSILKSLGSDRDTPLRDAYITPVNAWDSPVSISRRSDLAVPRRVLFDVGTLLVAGSTVEDEAENPYCQFVEILLPRHAYINRTHFNAGSGYLERVA